MPAITVRASADADIPAITSLYAHHVLYGTASFEEVPPDEAEMARRRADILARGLPYLVAECEGAVAGFSALGERGKPMEAVADKAVKAFTRWWKTGAAVDEHLADQLVLPAALAKGESRWTTEAVSEHLRTICWLVPQFLPVAATVEAREDGTGLVIVRPEA